MITGKSVLGKNFFRNAQDFITSGRAPLDLCAVRLAFILMETCRQHWGRCRVEFPQVGVSFHKTSPGMSRQSVVFDFVCIVDFLYPVFQHPPPFSVLNWQLVCGSLVAVCVCTVGM